MASLPRHGIPRPGPGPRARALAPPGPDPIPRVTAHPVRFLAFAVLLLAALSARAERLEASEAGVKAAFLYKFAAYVDWPAASFASPDTPFVIGVLDAPDMVQALDRITAGRRVGSHPVEVRSLGADDSVAGVNMLFVGRDAADALPAVVRAAQRQGALVVSEVDGGLEAGSAINFVLSDDHVGFEVSTPAAARSGHRISARLLAVARRVVQGAN